MWDEVKRLVGALKTGEITAAQHHEKIFAHEEKLNAKKNTPEGLSITDIDEHSGLFREGVKMAENQKVRISEELRTRVELLRDTMKIKEKEQEKLNDEGSVTGRGSSSRNSAMDFDGPNDSPVPSPADNRQARKLGGPSRTSSQPPRGAGDKDNTPSEASERASKPKIVYHQGQEVAFKRKIPGRNDEQDWIQGKVVRVIGEGKSRRYDVKDPFPEENSGPNVYKSSASQMVPIPPEGAKLGDFEPGRTVLALYPGTTTFYRAEVKAMLEGGKKVQLLFEGETDAQLSSQDRRFVLDHKG